MTTATTALTYNERSIRGHVRNYLCGLTEFQCYDLLAETFEEGGLKLRFIIEWCCEGWD